MKYKWLNKQKNNSLIIFFNGWGMNESVINHMDFSAHDFVMFYDYNSLDTDFDFDLFNQYEKKYLVAWSMGAMIATNFKKQLGKIQKSIAINGTLRPINDIYGIPTKIYDLTLRSFNETSATKFINNMFDKNENIPIILREFENIKTELIAIKNYKSDENFIYDTVYISTNDKIIPTKNQSEYWKKEPNLKSGHCPFLLFDSWDNIL